MKKTYLFPIIILGLVFLGTGCTNSKENNTKDSIQQEMKKDITESKKKEKQNNNTDSQEQENKLHLEAQARGAGQVHFDWTAPQDKKIDRFVIVRDEKPNPKHTGKNYWFRQPSNRRDVTWIDIPSGDYHFRICILQDGECQQYSNDVKVEVK